MAGGAKIRKTGLRISGSQTMADAEEFERAAAAWAKKATRSKETARAELVRMGIITPAGRLTKRYSR